MANRVGSLITYHHHDNIDVLNALSDVEQRLYYIDNAIVYSTDLAPYSTHVADLTIHVTQADKDLWNSILATANEYARQLVSQLKSFEIKKVLSLPEGDDIKENVIYFIKNTENLDANIYDEYMYIDGEWEIIGSTAIDITSILADYYTKAEVNEILSSYYNISQIDELISEALESVHTHDNKQVLDALSDSNGLLMYNGQQIAETYTKADVLNIMSYLWPNVDFEQSTWLSAEGKSLMTADGYIFSGKGGT